MKYATIDPSGLVLGVFTPQPGFTIEESFTPEEVALYELVPDEVEPGWFKESGGTIVAPIDLTPVNVSDINEPVYDNVASLTLNSEYSCTNCTLSYVWRNPGGLLISDATTSSLIFNSVTAEMSGTYSCSISASRTNGQTAPAEQLFNLRVYPTLTKVGGGYEVVP
jgi:hypothetical protein